MRGETPRWEPIIPSFSDPREAATIQSKSMRSAASRYFIVGLEFCWICASTNAAPCSAQKPETAAPPRGRRGGYWDCGCAS
jgi:hypothetical protein